MIRNSCQLAFVIALGFYSLATTKSCEGQEPEKLTIMTWNLEWFYDEHEGDNFSKLAKEKTAPSRDDWNWHRDAIGESIRKSKPTILALQEIENRRVLWYLSRSMQGNHQLKYSELSYESEDHFTEQNVGIMFRDPVVAVSTQQFFQTPQQRLDKQYFGVPKHLLATFEFPIGNGKTEQVTVMNLHLRSRPEGAELRRRQARLIRLWISDLIRQKKNVIVLGDTNTEQRGSKAKQDTELQILCGKDTPETDDDLIDLHWKLPPKERRTHLLPDREFDRILVSQSLLDDTPGEPDLIFESISVMPELAIQGKRDTPEQHWDNYWSTSPDERDFSDHYPVQATFVVQ